MQTWNARSESGRKIAKVNGEGQTVSIDAADVENFTRTKFTKKHLQQGGVSPGFGRTAGSSAIETSTPGGNVYHRQWRRHEESGTAMTYVKSAAVAGGEARRFQTQDFRARAEGAVPKTSVGGDALATPASQVSGCRWPKLGDRRDHPARPGAGHRRAEGKGVAAVREG